MNESVVVIVGNPLDGVQVFGPFNTWNDAHNWADNLPEYWITRMENPDE